MAIVFYDKATGKIYGVHPNLGTAPPVPSNIDNVAFPGPPATIPWPGPDPKGESFSRVNVANKQLLHIPGAIEKPTNVLRNKHAGKAVSALTQTELNDLLIAVGSRVGLVKDDGTIK